MKTLTEQEIALVEVKLKSLGIDYKPLYEDLLDHICTAIENQYDGCKAFNILLEENISSFYNESANDFTKLQKETVKQRNIPLKKKRNIRIASISSFVACLFFFLSFVVQAKEKPNIYPVKVFEKESIDKKSDCKVFTLKRSQKVFATADGIILESSSLGKTILIKHSNGYLTYYKNVDNIHVKNGQSVSKGETIGFIHLEDGKEKDLYYQVINRGKVII